MTDASDDAAFRRALINARQHASSGSNRTSIVSDVPLVMSASSDATNPLLTTVPLVRSEDVAAAMTSALSANYRQFFWTFQEASALALYGESAQSVQAASTLEMLLSAPRARLESIDYTSAQTAMQYAFPAELFVTPLLDGVYRLYGLVLSAPSSAASASAAAAASPLLSASATSADVENLKQRLAFERLEQCHLLYQRRVIVAARYQIVFASNSTPGSMSLASPPIVLSVPSAHIDNRGAFMMNPPSLHWYHYQAPTNEQVKQSEVALQQAVQDLRSLLDTVRGDSSGAAAAAAAVDMDTLFRDDRVKRHALVQRAGIDTAKRLMTTMASPSPITWSAVARSFGTTHWRDLVELRTTFAPSVNEVEFRDLGVGGPRLELRPPFRAGLYALVSGTTTTTTTTHPLCVFEVLSLPNPNGGANMANDSVVKLAFDAVQRRLTMHTRDAPTIVLYDVPFAPDDGSVSGGGSIVLDPHSAPFQFSPLERSSIQWYGLPFALATKTLSDNRALAVAMQQSLGSNHNVIDQRHLVETLASWMSSLASELRSSTTTLSNHALAMCGALSKPLNQAPNVFISLDKATLRQLLPPPLPLASDSDGGGILVFMAIEDSGANEPSTLFGIDDFPMRADRIVDDAIRTGRLVEFFRDSIRQRYEALMRDAATSPPPLTIADDPTATLQLLAPSPYGRQAAAIKPRRLLSVHLVALHRERSQVEVLTDMLMASTTTEDSVANEMFERAEPDRRPYMHPIDRHLPNADVPYDVFSANRPLEQTIADVSAIVERELATSQHQGYDTVMVRRLRDVMRVRAAVLFWLLSNATNPMSLSISDALKEATKYELAVRHRLYRVMGTSNAYYSFMDTDGVERLVPLLLSDGDERITLLSPSNGRLTQEALEWMEHLIRDHGHHIYRSSRHMSLTATVTPENLLDIDAALRDFINSAHHTPLLYEIHRRAQSETFSRQLNANQLHFERWFHRAVTTSSLYPALFLTLSVSPDAGLNAVVLDELLQAMRTLATDRRDQRKINERIARVANGQLARLDLLKELASQRSIYLPSQRATIAQVKRVLTELSSRSQRETLNAPERLLVDEFWHVDDDGDDADVVRLPYVPVSFDEQPRDPDAVYPLLDDLRTDTLLLRYWDEQAVDDLEFARMVRSAQDFFTLRLLWASYVYGRKRSDRREERVDANVPTSDTVFHNLFVESATRLLLAAQRRRSVASLNALLLELGVSFVDPQRRTWLPNRVPWFDLSDPDETERVMAVASGYLPDGAAGIRLSDKAMSRVGELLRRRNVMRPRYLPLLAIAPRGTINDAALEELRRRRRQEEEEEEARRRRQQLQQQQEAEAKRKADEEAAARRQAQEEAEAKRKAEEEALRRRQQAEEAERKRKADEEEARRRQQQQAAAATAEQAKRQAEAEAKAEQERRAQALIAAAKSQGEAIIDQLVEKALQPLRTHATTAHVVDIVRQPLSERLRGVLTADLGSQDGTASALAKAYAQRFQPLAENELRSYEQLVVDAVKIVGEQEQARTVADLEAAVARLRQRLAQLKGTTTDATSTAFADNLEAVAKQAEARKAQLAQEEAEAAKAVEEERQQEERVKQEAVRREKALADQALAEQQRRQAEASAKAAAAAAVDEESRRRAEAEAERQRQAELEAKQRAEQAQRALEEAQRLEREAEAKRQKEAAEAEAARRAAETAATAAAAAAVASAALPASAPTPPAPSSVELSADAKKRIAKIDEMIVKHQKKLSGLKPGTKSGDAAIEIAKKAIATLEAEKAKLSSGHSPSQQQTTKAQVRSIIAISEPSASPANLDFMIKTVRTLLLIQEHVLVEIARLLLPTNDGSAGAAAVAEALDRGIALLRQKLSEFDMFFEEEDDDDSRTAMLQSVGVLDKSNWLELLVSDDALAYASNMEALFSALARWERESPVARLRYGSGLTWRVDLLPLDDETLARRIEHPLMARGASNDLLAVEGAVRSFLRLRVPPTHGTIGQERFNAVVYPPREATLPREWSDRHVRRRLIAAHFRASFPLSTTAANAQPIIAAVEFMLEQNAVVADMANTDSFLSVLCYHGLDTTLTEPLATRWPILVHGRVYRQFDDSIKSQYVQLSSRAALDQLFTQLQAVKLGSGQEQSNDSGGILKQVWPTNQHAVKLVNWLLQRAAPGDVTMFYHLEQPALSAIEQGLFNAFMLLLLLQSPDSKLWIRRPEFIGNDDGSGGSISSNAVDIALRRFKGDYALVSGGPDMPFATAYEEAMRRSGRDERTALRQILLRSDPVAATSENTVLDRRLGLAVQEALLFRQISTLNAALMFDQPQRGASASSSSPMRALNDADQLTARRLFLDILLSGMASPDAALFHVGPAVAAPMLGRDGVACVLMDYMARDLRQAVTMSTSTDKKGMPVSVEPPVLQALRAVTFLAEGVQTQFYRQFVDVLNATWDAPKPNPVVDDDTVALRSWTQAGASAQQPPMAFCETLSQPGGVDRACVLLFGTTSVDERQRRLLAEWFVGQRTRVMVTYVPYAQRQSADSRTVTVVVPSSSGDRALAPRVLLYSTHRDAFVEGRGESGVIQRQELFLSLANAQVRSACYWLEYGATTKVLDYLVDTLDRHPERLMEHHHKFAVEGADVATVRQSLVETDAVERLFEIDLARVLEQILDVQHKLDLLDELWPNVERDIARRIRGLRVAQQLTFPATERKKALDLFDARLEDFAKRYADNEAQATSLLDRVAYGRRRTNEVMARINGDAATERDKLAAAREMLELANLIYREKMERR